MKKKKNDNSKKIVIILSIIIAVLLVIVGVLLIIILNNSKKEIIAKPDAIYIGTYSSNDRKDINIIKSYEQYKRFFDNTEITEASFKDYNYAVVEIDYDECSESDIKLADYTIDGKLITVEFNYVAGCGVCAPQYMYFFVPIDKDMNEVEFDFGYHKLNDPDCPQDVAYKPIIYLYPEKDMNVEVKVGNSNYLTTTYPKYNNGWKVFAKTNGDLYGENGRYFYGLYWEGNNHKVEIKEDGFIVEGKDVEKFLEEKLKVLGLTEREADEFIIYWLPKLEVNKYNYIRFETLEEINSYMPLEIDPNPDTLIRVLMDYKVLEEPIEVKEQELITPERKGFTVVEWGGSLIK